MADIMKIKLNDTTYNMGIQPYVEGDSVVCRYGTFAGYITGYTSIRFCIPISRPCIATKADITGSITIRSNGVYLLGAPSSYININTLSRHYVYVNENYITIDVVKDDQFKPTNGSPAITNHTVLVTSQDLTITFK